ncbi:acyl-CoA synthetase [Nonomuraea zeae]|uniref:Long-chain fatty acid--CoA ligase n=1 Tax=Nonomuraea zeae TaxID=1642303 RepID=A0A5S4G4K7_9ACTN|nr:long-chain fatty acid--CoA ligase [Nonomuraea zeae]TMR27444.1 long-chain fatty acid--CoA ligase [Nonomuraea zeae]
MRNAGLGGWPARRALMSPDRTAFVFGDRAVTYAQVHERTTALAHRLRAAGVARGDRVAYLGPNHLAFAETLFATHLLGAIFVPLNARLAAPELTYMLDHSGARLLIHAPELAATAAALPVTRIAVGDLPAESGDAEPVDVPVALDDPALILYTSGTTGRPKGAVLTHGNLVWNTFNLLANVDVTSDEVTLVSAPLFHVAALNQTLLPTFLKGGRSVIMPSWDVERCYDLIAEHRVTWMFGVTTMFAAFARSPRWPGADLSSLRLLMAGGAPVPPGLIRTYQERGLVFSQGYGMTETAPGATFLEPAMSARKAGSAGVPVFFSRVRVVRPDLTDAPPGEPGEILIDGPNVTPGYWNDPDATRAARAPGGWFRSGDIGAYDAEGHLYIMDRAKDMYISGGENVYPAEVESVLSEHPAVAEAAVFGVPDDTWGEVGRAVVVLKPGAGADAEDLVAFLRGRLAGYKVPRSVVWADELPRTSSGKIVKPALRAAYT